MSRKGAHCEIENGFKLVLKILLSLQIDYAHFKLKLPFFSLFSTLAKIVEQDISI